MRRYGNGQRDGNSTGDLTMMDDKERRERDGDVDTARYLLSKLPNCGNRDSHVDTIPLPLQFHSRRQDLPPGDLPLLAIALIGCILGVKRNPQDALIISPTNLTVKLNQY